MAEQVMVGRYPRRDAAPAPRKPITRRHALQLGAVITAATAGSFWLGLGTGEIAADATFGLANAEPKAAKAMLFADEVMRGRFNPETYRAVGTCTDALRLCKEKMLEEEARTGSRLVGAHVMIYDRRDSTGNQMTLGEVQPTVAIASVAKVPICHEAWLQGQRDGHTYLTPDLAEKILRYSSNTHLDQLVASLPGSGKADYPTYARLMTQAGIPPKGSAAPLRVALPDMLRFVASKPEFPDPMRTALTPRVADAPLTYYATEVAQKFVAAAKTNSQRELDPVDTQTHFKIGLINTAQTEGGTPDAPHVGWWFRQGPVDMVGYAIGGEYDARLAMLHAVGSASRYALRQYLPK